MAFLPISDIEDEPLAPPVMTVALIVVNVLVYFLVQPSVASSGAVGLQTRQFYDTYAMIPAQVAAGHHLYTILTAMFLHGGITHLAGNMLYLWIFGNNVEHAFGHVAYLGFYLACGVVATVLQVFLFPASELWNLGASGAIAGVLGAYLVLFPHAQINVVVWTGAIRRMSALLVIGLWFVLQLFSGGSQLMSVGREGGVAYWAHVGGFAAGAGIALLMWGWAGDRSRP